MLLTLNDLKVEPKISPVISTPVTFISSSTPVVLIPVSVVETILPLQARVCESIDMKTRTLYTCALYFEQAFYFRRFMSNLPCHSLPFLYHPSLHVDNHLHLCREIFVIIYQNYFYRPSSVISPVTSLIVETSRILEVPAPIVQEM